MKRKPHLTIALAVLAALAACEPPGGMPPLKPETSMAADFSVSNNLGLAPLTVTFTDLSQGGIDSWNWDFNDDGTTDSTEQNPVFVYTADATGRGGGNVRLTVSGPEGSATVLKTLNPVRPGLLPYIYTESAITADFSFAAGVGGTAPGSVPLNMLFTPQTSPRMCQTTWDFNGDGVCDITGRSDFSVWHTYYSPVTGEVSVTAVFSGDLPGNSCTVTKTVSLDLKRNQQISDCAGGFNGALDDGDNFGWAVAEVGDLDGNGAAELAVGAPGDDDGGQDAGALWIIFMRPDGTALRHQKISNSGGNLPGTIAAGDGFGRSVTFLGDINGDGIADIAAGAPGDGGGTGAVWILCLDPSGCVASGQKIDAVQGGGARALDPRDWFGISLAAIGNLDGDQDGVCGLAVGAYGDDDGEFSDDSHEEGAVWILFLNKDGTVKAQRKISSREGGLAPLRSGSGFGKSIAFIGGQGPAGGAKIAVASGEYGKQIRVLSLNPDGTVKDEHAVGGSDFPDSPLAAWNFRVDGVAGVGDLDNDGADDLALCYDDLFLIFVYLRDDGSLKAYSSIDGRFSFKHICRNLCKTGDLNGDGIDDLILGDPLNDDGGTAPVGGTALYADRGAVWFAYPDGSGSVIVKD